MRLPEVIAARCPPRPPGRSSDWADRIACWTIRHAASSAPAALSERLEEEWLADLETRQGRFSRLRLALGCCWAAAVIAQELAPDLTAATTTGHKTMSSYARTDGSLLPQRTTALLLIVCLHVGLILAFASGLGRNVVAIIPKNMVGEFFPDARRDPPPPPPKFQPTLTQIDPKFPLDPPPVRFDTDESPPDGPTLQVPMEPPVGPPQTPPAPKPLNRVAGGVGKGFPNTDDYYPPSSIRLGEAGAVAVQVCVNGAGRLTSAPTLSQSSGSARLDEGALRLAKAGSGHYRATTENGQPVDACFGVHITFQLKDR